ncbi:MAG TPA: insulinase family protein, partial [Caulobacteraceae bacterium]
MRLLLPLLALLALAAPAAAQTPVSPIPTAARADVVQPDPAVRRGVLPNGLRYAVMSNKQPAEGVSIRLNIDVGSFEEAEDERGIAHFLEHMAFNGTRTIAEGELDRVFAAQGVAFGRDQNASTSSFDTTYFLDLSLADPAKLELAFRWMREVADGMVLSREAVERERGVVLAEHDTGLGPARTLFEAQTKFLSPELRGPTRWPIGTRETLKAIDAARLRAFYDRWYRPENASVVIVGDLPVEELERRVAQTFGTWRGKGPAPVRTRGGGPNLARGLDVLVRPEPQLPSSIAACRTQPRDPPAPETPARWRERMPRILWEHVLDERLRRLSQSREAPFGAASINRSEAYREAAYICLSARPLNEDWKRALDAALQEARRMELHGPTVDELKRAVASMRTDLHAAVAQASTRRSAALAAVLLADLSDEEEQEVFSRPEENLRLFEAGVAGVTPATVHAAFRRDWAGAGPLIVVSAPQPPKAEEVRTAWAAATARPAPAAPTDGPKVEWGYKNFGAPGTVVRRETVADPGFTRLFFANGLVMNFKQVAFTRDRVDVSIRFGAGRSGLPYQSTLVPMLAARMTTEGGLGRHDHDELTRLFQARRWSVNLGMGDNYYGLSGASSPADLDLQMQIMAAYLVDPGFRPNMDAKIPTAVEGFYRMYRTEPQAVIGQAIGEAVAPGGPTSLPPKATLMALRASDFERMMRPVLREAPLEVTVVGDIDEAKAVDAVARTLGALPRRSGSAARSANPPFLRFPANPPAEIRATHEGAAEKAVAGVIWPLYVAVPERRREEYALQLLGGVFSDALRRRVREALGKSYSPGVGVSMP